MEAGQARGEHILMYECSRIATFSRRACGGHSQLPAFLKKIEGFPVFGRWIPPKRKTGDRFPVLRDGTVGAQGHSGQWFWRSAWVFLPPTCPMEEEFFFSSGICFQIHFFPSAIIFPPDYIFQFNTITFIKILCIAIILKFFYMLNFFFVNGYWLFNILNMIN